jgi:hypothetical protein
MRVCCGGLRFDGRALRQTSDHLVSDSSARAPDRNSDDLPTDIAIINLRFLFHAAITDQ